VFVEFLSPGGGDLSQAGPGLCGGGKAGQFLYRHRGGAAQGTDRHRLPAACGGKHADGVRGILEPDKAAQFILTANDRVICAEE